MARKKNVKPLFEVKHDFIDSFEAFIQASMMLYLSVRSALDLGAIKGHAASNLRERVVAWEAATLPDQGADE